MALSDSARKKELAKDLDMYLSQRRQQDAPVVASQPKPYDTQPEETSVDVVEDDLEYAPKKSWFSNVMERLFGPEEEATLHEEPEEDVPEGDPRQDLREVASIALLVIKQLPNKTLEEFKESRDFVKFKEILRRHKIIK